LKDFKEVSLKNELSKSPMRRPSSADPKDNSTTNNGSGSGEESKSRDRKSSSYASAPKGRFSGIMPAIYKLVGLDIAADYETRGAAPKTVDGLQQAKFNTPPPPPPPRGTTTSSAGSKVSPSPMKVTTKKKPVLKGSRSDRGKSGGGTSEDAANMGAKSPQESRLSASLARSKEKKLMEDARKKADAVQKAKRRLSEGIPIMDHRPGTPI
jgi:hypothetical protein